MALVPSHLVELCRTVGDATSSGSSVAVVGRGTRRLANGETTDRVPDTTVRAPRGIIEFQPDEMILRCGAGTDLDEIREVLATAGQELNVSGHGTIGGALARGWSDVNRLGRGPLRDVLLETIMVDHLGRAIRVGGPTVKNVTGFDLARILVGSLGTLGFFGDVTIRTRPRPLESRWVSIDDVDRRAIEEIHRRLYRPTSLLWNGSTCWIHLEGHPRDLDEQLATWTTHPCETPVLGPHRWSLAPDEALNVPLEAGDVVEVGVGLVHRHCEAPRRSVVSPEIHRRLDEEFDPRGLLNPQVVKFGRR